MHNRVDWCVRGYSHTFYNRGQDSAGILIYEQSSQQHRRVQLGHARRRRALSLGRPVDDGHRPGRRERQRRSTTTISASRRPTASRRRSAATSSTATASRSAGTGCGAATASIRGLPPTTSRATPRRSRSSTARTTGSPRTVFDGDETAIRLWKNATQDPNWEYPEAARHAQPRLRHLGQHLRAATRSR